MPVILKKTSIAENEPTLMSESELLSCVTKESGDELTTEGQIARNFIETVDLSDLFEDADVQEFIEETDGYAKLATDENGQDFYEACEPADEGAEQVVIRTLPGYVAAMFVDEDDLCDMFAFHAVNEMPNDNVSNKALRLVAMAMLGEPDADAVNEYKKGDFVKLRKSPAGKALVNRMLGAMVAKGEASKAAPGNKARYKAPGSNKATATFTKGGTKAGAIPKHKLNGELVTAGQRTVPRWLSYKAKHTTNKNKNKTLGAKTTVTGSKKVTNVQSIKKASVKAVAKKGAAKAAVKANNKLKGGGKGKGLGESEHETGRTTNGTVNEAASYGLPGTLHGNINENRRIASSAIAKMTGYQKPKETAVND